MEAALESQENERRRVAGDLHDSIGGMLSAIRVGLTTIARQLPDPQGMEQPKKMLDDTIDSVRSHKPRLMPSHLERFGLVHALRELCDRFKPLRYYLYIFKNKGKYEALDQRKAADDFRVAQELVNNAIKHAQRNRNSGYNSDGNR